MTTSDPTTGEIVRALRFCYESEEIECYECPCRVSGGAYLCHMDKLADRLESQERKLNDYAPFEGLRDADAIDTDIIELLMSNEKELRNWIVRASWHCAKVHTQSDEIAALTARAEQAEKERDAAVAVIGIQAEKLKESHVVLCNICEFEDMIGCVHKNHCDGYQLFKWRGLPREGEGVQC